MTYTNLPQHDLRAHFYFKFLLITQHEVKRQKKSNDRTERTVKLDVVSFACITACTKIEYLCEYLHKCEHMKACQIRRGAKFGKKHMAATGVQDKAIRKKYLSHKLRLIFFVRMRHRVFENRISLHFLPCPSAERSETADDSTIEKLSVTYLRHIGSGAALA